MSILPPLNFEVKKKNCFMDFPTIIWQLQMQSVIFLSFFQSQYFCGPLVVHSVIIGYNIHKRMSFKEWLRNAKSAHYNYLKLLYISYNYYNYPLCNFKKNVSIKYEILQNHMIYLWIQNFKWMREITRMCRFCV